MRQRRWQESLRSMKMRSGIEIDDSSPVNTHIAAGTAELNSNGGRADCIHSSAVGRPERDLGRWLQTISGGTVVDSGLTYGTKLDSFYEGVLSGRLGNSDRILKRGQRIWRTGISKAVCGGD